MNLTELRDYVDEIEATPLDALLENASADVRAALEQEPRPRGADRR